MATNAYKHLLSEGKIGSLTLRNRIVVTAMGASLAEADGHCGERLIRYHEEQARGGAGLIIMGVTGVAWPVGGNQINQIAISDDKFLPGLKKLAQVVHSHGAKIAAQLHHGGMVAVEDGLAGRPLWTPSIPEPPTGDFTESFLLEELETAPFTRITDVQLKIMTVEDIQTVVRQFAEAGARAKEAGIDGVEIHGGHGYLLSAFISPRTNKRDDAYGGSLENRARFLVEVVAAVRAATGPDFPIWCKLDSREVGRAGGITIEDAMLTAKMVEAAGADAITVTAYHDTSQASLHSGSHTPHEPAVNLPFASQIRASINIPVIASGRVEPEVAEDYLSRGGVDFISMGRKLLADPHLPNKLAEGREADVRPCIYCYTCISAIYICDLLRCAVNPDTGAEYKKPADLRGGRRVVVIGGGPGGMEAARQLDELGHQVTLIEQAKRLGGTLRFASLAYPANERLLDWLELQLSKSSVDVRLDTVATADVLNKLAPDAVIVATGARRDMPDIPGADLAHVFSGDDMRRMVLGESSEELKRKTGLLTRLATRVGAATGLTANLDFVRSATKQWMPLGKDIVIIGGELVGLELAEFLTERGRRVTVVDEVPRFGAGLTVVRRMRLIDELKEHGVALAPSAKNIRITPEAVEFTDAAGQPITVGADNVVVAKGARADLTLADALKAQGFNIYEVGDCTGVSYIEGAIRDATRVVREISAA